MFIADPIPSPMSQQEPARKGQIGPFAGARCLGWLLWCWLAVAVVGHGQGESESGGEGAEGEGAASFMEDRAARRLVEAGDARLEADEADKAVEIWQSVLDRYPASRHRFEARMRLGDYLLDERKDYDAARLHYEVVASEDNPDDAARARGLLRTGICLFQSREYARCFSVLRGVIEIYPNSSYANEAYHHIGLAHFRQGHYGRAISALEKVGTAFGADDVRLEVVEAGRRLYVRVDDRDLATLGPDERLSVRLEAASGDVEEVLCQPVGRNADHALGSIPTALGPARPGNGVLEVRGGDRVRVIYEDQHTADGSFDQSRESEVRIVGTAVVRIMDGPFERPMDGVVVGKEAHLEVYDPDYDVSGKADSLRAVAEVQRRKTDLEIEEERAEIQTQRVLEAEAAAAAAAAAGEAVAEVAVELAEGEFPEEGLLIEVDPWKTIDRLAVTLTEAVDVAGPGAAAAAAAAAAVEQGGAVEQVAVEQVAVEQAVVEEGGVVQVHTARFRASVPVELAEIPNMGDQVLSGRPGDRVRLLFRDEVNLTGSPIDREATAMLVEGDLGDVRVAQAMISDPELRLKTHLRTAQALTQVGSHYRDFGLASHARTKFGEALEVCREALEEARGVGGSLLEQTYVQLWRIYFAMGEHGQATQMAGRLQREFPESAFVDEAILQQAHAAREAGELARAATLYQSVVGLSGSGLRDEGQFGLGATYEAMAAAASAEQAMALYERAFSEYQKVYENFPASGRVGEAVAKMANFYYQSQDYRRAIDTFEKVLDEHPDAAFLDVILFNYGRCLYRMEQPVAARRQFDQLLADFPDSPLAGEAKRVSAALGRVGSEE
jgi:tetratricopeptide (TPR) repeat protein